MKGAEERDLIFAKLFGYLSLIRSGKMKKNEENILPILDRLLELHNRKGWVREVVCEAILSLLDSIDSENTAVMIPKLQGLIGDCPLPDMAAWQLMLCIGIQQYCSRIDSKDVAVRDNLLELLPQPDMCTPSSFAEMTPTLIEATSGFPKVLTHLLYVSIYSFTYLYLHLYLLYQQWKFICTPSRRYFQLAILFVLILLLNCSPASLLLLLFMPLSTLPFFLLPCFSSLFSVA